MELGKEIVSFKVSLHENKVDQVSCIQKTEEHLYKEGIHFISQVSVQVEDHSIV